MGWEEVEKCTGAGRKIPGDTINNIYCICEVSLAVALDSVRGAKAEPKTLELSV